MSIGRIAGRLIGSLGGLGCVPHCGGFLAQFFVYVALLLLYLFVPEKQLTLNVFSLLFVLLFSVGVFLVHKSEYLWGQSESSCFVFDSVLGLVLLFYTVFSYWDVSVEASLLLFFFYVYLVTVKPWPVYRFQKFGNVAVVLDDVVAAVVAFVAFYLMAELYGYVLPIITV